MCLLCVVYLLRIVYLLRVLLLKVCGEPCNQKKIKECLRRGKILQWSIDKGTLGLKGFCYV